MKTRGKSKIFKCLRPATADDGLFKQSKPRGGFDVPEHSPGSDEGGGRGGDGGTAAGHPKLLRFFSLRKPDQSSDESSAAADDPNIPKGKSRGKFRRVLKAVLFEASLLRKLRRSNSFMGLRSRASSLSSKSQKMSRNESFSSRGLTESDKVSRMNSDCSSRLSASSMMTARDMPSPCSSCLLTRSASEVHRQSSPMCCLDRNRSISSRMKQNIVRGRYCSAKVGYCCLILCLLALVFWGKALAILCISAWLYFAPLCFQGATDPPPEFEPGECMVTNQCRHARRLSGI